MLRLIPQGDIFESGVQALVNPVNCEGAMGKGLALAFKQRFLANYYAYRDACRQQQVRIGRMYVFEIVDTPQNCYIINFPTKQSWRNPSKLHYIEAGLRDLTRVIQEYQITSIAIPALGSGLGGLEWDDVFPLIQQEAVRWACQTLVYAPH